MGAFDTLQAARKEPRLVGSATTKAQVNLSTITINVPTGVQDGDLLVCFLSGFLGSIPPANIAGWGVLFTSGVTTTVDVAVFFRIASSEPASYSFNTSGSSADTAAVMVAYRNARIGWTADATSLLPTIAGIRVPLAGGKILAYCTNAGNDANTYSTPSGCTSIASSAVANTPPLALFEGPFTPGQQTSPALTSTESGGTGGVGIQLLLLPSDIDITQLQPTFIADSNVSVTTAATTIVVPKPAGTVEGDLIVVVLAPSVDVNGFTDASGFTYAYAGSLGDFGQIAYKIAGASEPSTYTFTAGVSTRMSAYGMTFRNAEIGSVAARSAGNNVSVSPTAVDFAKVYAVQSANGNSTFTTQTPYFVSKYQINLIEALGIYELAIPAGIGFSRQAYIVASSSPSLISTMAFSVKRKAFT